MKDKIPGININVKQVVNKMKRWSTKLNEVVDMMNTSGFAWNDVRKCVTVDSSQVLSEFLKKHPKFGNHVNKEFKEFERLQGIFGKDCANGRRAETAADAMENKRGDNQAEDDDDWLQQHDISPPSVGNTSIRIEHASVGTPAKRQRLAQLATRFVESFDIKMYMVTADFAKVVAKLPRSLEKDMVAEFRKLRLTQEERIDLALKFANNKELEKFFWEFKGLERMAFVKRIMQFLKV